MQRDAAIEAQRIVKEALGGYEFSNFKTPKHFHNGVDAPKIKQADVVPNLRALGNITMRQTATTYKFGLNFNPTQIQFIGLALHRTGTGPTDPIDMRAMVNGNAQLGPSYMFEDDGTGKSVTVGGAYQAIIQASAAFVADSSGGSPVIRAITSEENLVYVVYPTAADIVAVAEVTDYGPGYASVFVTLAAQWEIQGNFIVT